MLRAFCYGFKLQVRYKLCYAKLLDFRKKFLEAARRYQELSLEPKLSVTEQNELLRHSVSAIICCCIFEKYSGTLILVIQPKIVYHVITPKCGNLFKPSHFRYCAL